MKALLVVDVQNDFCPGGALAVQNGDAVVPVINGMMAQFPLVVASKDWHPDSTVHFRKWPVHCVHDSHGAEFHPALKKDDIRQVFFKGTKDKDDGYSAFESTNLDLSLFLKEKGIDEIYVAGLATDYCVKATAIDAVRLGFKSFVVADAVAAVNIKPEDGTTAFLEMQNAGVRIVLAKDIR
jgi:nicotinamidase/pyrazinamidase